MSLFIQSCPLKCVSLLFLIRDTNLPHALTQVFGKSTLGMDAYGVRLATVGS